MQVPGSDDELWWSYVHRTGLIVSYLVMPYEQLIILKRIG
jgi:hypothetical protein